MHPRTIRAPIIWFVVLNFKHRVVVATRTSAKVRSGLEINPYEKTNPLAHVLSALHAGLYRTVSKSGFSSGKHQQSSNDLILSVDLCCRVGERFGTWVATL